MSYAEDEGLDTYDEDTAGLEEASPSSDGFSSWLNSHGGLKALQEHRLFDALRAAYLAGRLDGLEAAAKKLGEVYGYLD